MENAEEILEEISKLNKNSRGPPSLVKKLKGAVIKVLPPSVRFYENSYVLHNKIVKSKFTLTKEQEDAIKEIIEVFLSSKEHSMCLSGYAGTGKSSILNLIEQVCHLSNIGVIFSAPTNRAVKIIKDKTLGSTVKTIHKLLGLKPAEIEDPETYSVKNIKFFLDSIRSIRAKIVIIDEASMMDDFFTDIILEFFHDKKVIFVGDEAQLSGVTNQGKESKIFDPNFHRVVKLTQVQRTSSVELLDLLYLIRNKEVFPIQNSSSFTYYNLLKDFQDKIYEVYQKGYTVNSHKILCGTNEAVARYNTMVHNELYLNSEYGIGELITSYCNNQEFFMNSDDAIVKGTYSFYKEFGGKEYLIHCIDIGENEPINVFSRDNDFNALSEYVRSSVFKQNRL